MRPIKKHSRLLLVAVCCLALGAGAGAIANAGAASQSSAKTHGRYAPRARFMRRALLRAGGLRLGARRAVQGNVVVATRTGFATITFDRGTIASVNRRQLVLNDGTAKATYKQVTLTIPANARVRDNGTKASIGDLRQGQRVIVIQAPRGTFVIAHTPNTAG